MENLNPFESVKPCARRQMNLFYLIDCSSSMRGNKIESINQVMPDIMRTIADIDESNKDNAQIKVACLEFSTGCQWKYPQPVLANDFKWQDIQAGGVTDLGAAFKELRAHMSRNSDLASDTGHYAPAVILLSDGRPTDAWKNALKDLQSNKWFQVATKVAIAVGDDADKTVLNEFADNKDELVITVHNLNALKSVIRLVSCTVSKIGSNSTSVGEKTKSDEICEMVDDAVKETPGAENANHQKPQPDIWD